jgi:hypothetical protein
LDHFYVVWKREAKSRADQFHGAYADEEAAAQAVTDLMLLRIRAWTVLATAVVPNRPIIAYRVRVAP